MKAGKLEKYWRRAREEIRKSFSEDHTPHETASSFAIGSFIVLIPTFPVGLLILGFLAVTFDRVNKISLFAPTVILNPAVKVGFYALSLQIGRYLLDFETINAYSGISILQAFNTGVTTLTGSIIAATMVSAAGYLAIYRLVTIYTN